MDFKTIKERWSNAHPEWKIVVRKKNGKTYFKEKEKTENVYPEIVSTIQRTETVCEVH